MKIVTGVFSTAKIFTDNIEDYAISQIQMICDNEAAKDSKICIMPDVHPGKVGPVGLSMTVGERVLPNLIGVDIGCGMTMIHIKEKRMEYQKLDTVIRDGVPVGSAIRNKSHYLGDEFDYSQLICRKHISEQKAILSLGTLGGGNHFIEVDVDEDGELYVVVHSGSRHLGVEVTEYYLKEGQKKLKARGLQVPYEMTWLEGALRKAYLHDLMILRKGAISARMNEDIIIPINMRDGIILGRGLGNLEWNQSAPHGSGRLVKRSDVTREYTVSDFKKAMEGIYCSCIGKDTLDESPMAYRGMEEIRNAIGDTVEIQKIIHPVYNFKAGSK